MSALAVHKKNNTALLKNYHLLYTITAYSVSGNMLRVQTPLHASTQNDKSRVEKELTEKLG